MLKLSVGISAYNAEQNIVRLLNEVIAEREDDFTLVEVLVHVDRGSDRTAAVARAVPDPRIRVIEAVERQGFAGAVRLLLAESRGDVTVLLNDDIVVAQTDALARTAAAFSRDSSLALAFGRPVPYPGGTFVERANFAGWAWFDDIRSHLPHGGDELGADGKYIAVRAPFASAVIRQPFLPGNVDTFLYYLAREFGYPVLVLRDVAVRFKNPTMLDEHLRWHARNFSEAAVVRQHFPKALPTKIPRRLYLKTFIRQCLRQPLGMLFIILMTPAVRQRAAAEAGPYWPTISSTKQLP